MINMLGDSYLLWESRYPVPKLFFKKSKNPNAVKPELHFSMSCIENYFTY